MATSFHGSELPNSHFWIILPSDSIAHLRKRHSVSPSGRFAVRNGSFTCTTGDHRSGGQDTHVCRGQEPPLSSLHHFYDWSNAADALLILQTLYTFLTALTTCGLNTVAVSTNPGAAKILPIPIIKEPLLIIKESRRRARRDRLQVIYLLHTMLPTTLPSRNSSCTCLTRPVNLLGLMEEEILRIYNEECRTPKAVNSQILTLSENTPCAGEKIMEHTTERGNSTLAPYLQAPGFKPSGRLSWLTYIASPCVSRK
jgi:hypothetical protein